MARLNIQLSHHGSELSQSIMSYVTFKKVSLTWDRTIEQICLVYSTEIELSPSQIVGCGSVVRLSIVTSPNIRNELLKSEFHSIHKNTICL